MWPDLRHLGLFQHFSGFWVRERDALGPLGWLSGWILIGKWDHEEALLGELEHNLKSKLYICNLKQIHEPWLHCSRHCWDSPLPFSPCNCLFWKISLLQISWNRRTRNIWISFNYIHQLFKFCAICPNYVLMQLFPYPWKVSCRHYNTVSLNALALFPNNKDVLTHHHSLSHSRNLTLIIMILLNILSIKNLPQLSPKCPYFKSPGLNQGSTTAFRFDVLWYLKKKAN